MYQTRTVRVEDGQPEAGPSTGAAEELDRKQEVADEKVERKDEVVVRHPEPEPTARTQYPSDASGSRTGSTTANFSS